ncbi:LuxR C-terminal-related transcriptional regulator [Defluviitalea raffinosedens]|uniref:LuxR C-terminal-related transcriptional regulator n=1 Tax=Defluviitalea raffinosedens TaxID=1450156 RepID=UPI001DFDE629|nr:LuxR C-terminal-related transcriptional regulator [Defluviitalea raffinosedens]MBM7685989.1 DNA-binding CsgD family transcriptional regulator [Defluviitalea raffinosedens]
MKNQFNKIWGLICYLFVLSLLFNFNWMLLLRPKPFFSVILGTVILTFSQYKKEYNKEDITVSLRWNLVFSSFLTTLLSLLAAISDMRGPGIDTRDITESLLPMLYGSIIYLILNILVKEPVKKETEERPMESLSDNIDLFDPALAQKIFIEYGLTNRECHVALKLLENISNKEIASQLYISEATVKKHIQNIYQKFGATDRSNFKAIYLESIKSKS